MIYWAIYQTLISGLILCPESIAQSASSRSHLLPFVYAVNFDGSDPDMLAGFRASNERAGSRLGGTRKGDRAAVSMIDILEDDEDHILIIKFPFSQQGFGYSFDGKKPPIVSKLNVNSGKQ